jgi:alanine racemase
MSFAFAEINLANIERNIAYIKSKVGTHVEILAVVKANAYGHGSVEISRKLVSLNIRNLAVATYEEAMEIKSENIHSNILILGSITNEEIISCIKKGLLFTVYDISQLYFIDSLNLENINFHLKIDTGMNRLGLEPKEVSESLKIISTNKSLELHGVYTHLPESNLADSAFTNKQIALFESIILETKAIIPSVRFFHIANSSAIFNFSQLELNMVRPGLALYGLSTEKNDQVFPLMKLKTSIVKIRNIIEGDSVSYGRTFIAKNEMQIGVIPIGYADGLPRALSNKGRVLYGETECEILGRVCMDLTIIDLSKVTNPQIGDEIVIFGNHKVSVNKIADISETIPYDIVCGISKRVKRVYK